MKNLPLKFNLNHYVYFLHLWILFAAGDIHAQTPTKVLSFQELNSQIGFAGQTIQIRGFLYKNDHETWVLLNKPNLKSCCFDKQPIILNIDGTFTDPGLQGVAVLIEGELQKSPTLTLINARLINEDKGMDTIYLLLAGLGLLLAIAFWIKK